MRSRSVRSGTNPRIVRLQLSASTSPAQWHPDRSGCTPTQCFGARPSVMCTAHVQHPVTPGLYHRSSRPVKWQEQQHFAAPGIFSTTRARHIPGLPCMPPEPQQHDGGIDAFVPRQAQHRVRAVVDPSYRTHINRLSVRTVTAPARLVLVIAAALVPLLPDDARGKIGVLFRFLAEARFQRCLKEASL